MTNNERAVYHAVLRMGMASINQIADALDCANESAKKISVRLMEKGFLTRKKVSRCMVYTAVLGRSVEPAEYIQKYIKDRGVPKSERPLRERLTPDPIPKQAITKKDHGFIYKGLDFVRKTESAQRVRVSHYGFSSSERL